MAQEPERPKSAKEDVGEVTQEKLPPLTEVSSPALLRFIDIFCEALTLSVLKGNNRLRRALPFLPAFFQCTGCWRRSTTAACLCHWKTQTSSLDSPVASGRPEVFTTRRRRPFFTQTTLSAETA